MTGQEKDPINELIFESGLDSAEYARVVDALAALRDAVPASAPEPSPQLAALLSGGKVTPLRSLRRSPAALAGAVAAVVLVGTGVGAAANVLPEPAQRFFSEFSDDHLPFHIPSPDERDSSGPSQDAPGQVDNPGLGQDIEGDGPGQRKGQAKPGNPQSTPQKGKSGQEKSDNGNHTGLTQGTGTEDAPGLTKESGEPAKSDAPGQGKGKAATAPTKPTKTKAAQGAGTGAAPTPAPTLDTSERPGNGNGNGDAKGNADGNSNVVTNANGKANRVGNGLR